MDRTSFYVTTSRLHGELWIKSGGLGESKKIVGDNLSQKIVMVKGLVLELLRKKISSLIVESSFDPSYLWV